MKNKYVKIEVFKKSSESWYPSYDGGLVKVGLSECIHETPFVVYITGNDDDMMNKGYATYEEAFGVFWTIIEMADVTHKAGLELGLEP